MTDRIFKECEEIIDKSLDLGSLTFKNLKHILLDNLKDDHECVDLINKKDSWHLLKPKITQIIQKKISNDEFDGKSTKDDKPAPVSELDSDAELHENKKQKGAARKKREKKASDPKPTNKQPLSPAIEATDAATDVQEQIKKLKTFVFKCGLRKNWKKELDGLSESQQLSKLKLMLSDLGMEGRPTLAKCAQIKEKIEYEKEMQAIDPSNILKSSRRSQQTYEKPAPKYAQDSDFSEASDEGDSMKPLDLTKLGDPEAD